MYYYAALTHGLTTNDWQGETLTIAAKGADLEKAGSPKAPEVDAAFADLPPNLKPWLLLPEGRRSNDRTTKARVRRTRSPSPDGGPERLASAGGVAPHASLVGHAVRSRMTLEAILRRYPLDWPFSRPPGPPGDRLMARADDPRRLPLA